MKNVESKPRYTNPLIHSSSPYLRQHAHNPVYWYPWGQEALQMAKTQNKPILLSIGYSTCYWCHVMEREVFENPSIASLMNKSCINIKVDREEHPQLDEIYMVARQLLTQQGGWPNNIFLTPDLKPFYAGGTFAADESYGKPGFPRVIEWVEHMWREKRHELDDVCARLTKDMQRFLIQTPAEKRADISVSEQAKSLYEFMYKQFDGRAGGFFQAPKFPHEPYHAFLLEYYAHSGAPEALDMVTQSLAKMAAGGLYDHVACGFHRYAVDKEWYVPHFEKMLYNQAQMARLYTQAAVLTGSEYFADIAKSVLEFVSGPMTSAHGAFYTAIDAETDGVEGAYYAWTAEELARVLTTEEQVLLTAIYAMADIPTFPGHKHVDGQVLIARKPIDAAARDTATPYIQLASICGKIMNKLLVARNKRQAPALDDKIITSWNGLMIDALAHAGKAFHNPSYIGRAQEAADFILEYLVDNDGQLYRIRAAGRMRYHATLEDYAYLIKGLLSLQAASPSQTTLDAIETLTKQCKEQLWDNEQGGFFAMKQTDDMLCPVKNADDGALPAANGVMLQNLYDLAQLTDTQSYRDDAQALQACFITGNANINAEYATIVAAALSQEAKALQDAPQHYKVAAMNNYADDAVSAKARIVPADAKPGEKCTVEIDLHIADGWSIQTDTPKQPDMIPTQIDVQGAAVQIVSMHYPKNDTDSDNPVWQDHMSAKCEIQLPDGPQRAVLRVMISFQPCKAQSCFLPRNIVLTV